MLWSPPPSWPIGIRGCTYTGAMICTRSCGKGPLCLFIASLILSLTHPGRRLRHSKTSSQLRPEREIERYFAPTAFIINLWLKLSIDDILSIHHIRIPDNLFCCILGWICRIWSHHIGVIITIKWLMEVDHSPNLVLSNFFVVWNRSYWINITFLPACGSYQGYCWWAICYHLRLYILKYTTDLVFFGFKYYAGVLLQR